VAIVSVGDASLLRLSVVGSLFGEALMVAIQVVALYHNEAVAKLLYQEPWTLSSQDDFAFLTCYNPLPHRPRG
jgi:hypothetical protein